MARTFVSAGKGLPTQRSATSSWKLQLAVAATAAALLLAAQPARGATVCQSELKSANMLMKAKTPFFYNLTVSLHLQKTILQWCGATGVTVIAAADGWTSHPTYQTNKNDQLQIVKTMIIPQKWSYKTGKKDDILKMKYGKNVKVKSISKQDVIHINKANFKGTKQGSSAKVYSNPFYGKRLSLFLANNLIIPATLTNQ